jgi:aspartyl-tRNA(Asn)/glutamyl-tRNA(Gln) amidotransferase subunit C
MNLTIKEVEHIADLARLELTDPEKELFRGQLSAILDYAKSLQNVETGNILPTSSVLPQHSALRPDEVTPSLSTQAVLSNGPQVEANQFRVPPVFE